MSRNILLYYLYKMIGEIYIIGPIITIFFLDRGLSFTEIMILQSSFLIANIIFEVPSGAFADKFGRKLSVILGLLLEISSMALMALSFSFTSFLISEILFGIGLAMISGADSAILYDTLLEQKREDEYSKKEGHAIFLRFTFAAVSCLFAGYAYNINPALPLFISVGTLGMGLIFISLIKEPTLHKSGEKHTVKMYIGQIKDGFTYIFSHTKLRAVIIFIFCFIAFSRGSHWFYQPYMQQTGITVEYFGIFYAVMNMVAALASKFNHIFIRLTKGKTLATIAITFSLTYIIMGTVARKIGMSVVFYQQIIRGVYDPIIGKYINKHTPSDKRATVISFNGLSGNIACALLINPLVGVLMDSAGVFRTLIVIGIGMLVASLVLYRYLEKALGGRKNNEGGRKQ